MKKIAFGTLLFQMLLASTVFGQLLQVDLTIFGMDCGLCAHAVHTGLLKIEGVQKVDISLEKGLAHFEIRPDNKITLQQIENTVRRNGFSPKGANVELKGSVQGKDNSLQVIISGSNETIKATTTHPMQTDHQREYIIRGVLKIDEKGTESLSITSIQ